MQRPSLTQGEKSNFSAKHHNNFSEAQTFSSGRFQSISHAKRGVRCPKGIETRLNFHSVRSGKTIPRPCNFLIKFSFNLQLGEIQKHKSCEARCAVPKGFEIDTILSEAPVHHLTQNIPSLRGFSTSSARNFVRLFQHITQLCIFFATPGGMEIKF